MAYYLVKGKPKQAKLHKLKRKLEQKAFKDLKPFGKALSYSLENARWWDNETIAWEEEDYCSPPLKEEKEAVLDHYFEIIELREVRKGFGWGEINELPQLFDFEN